MKISLMEDITLYRKGDICKIEIKKDKVAAENLNNILIKYNPLDFQILDLKEEDNKYILNYKIEDGYRCIADYKKYDKTLVLGVINTILNKTLEDTSTTFKVLLHPNNIYFRDTNDIKFIYRGNDLLPSLSTPLLEQFKLLILSLLSKHTYEQLKDKVRRKKLLEKEKNDFLSIVENSTKFEDISELVKKELVKRQTELIFNKHKEESTFKRKSKMKNYIMLGSIAGITILSILFTTGNNIKIKVECNKKISDAENLNNAYYTLIADDLEKGTDELENTKIDKEKLANVYFATKQYSKMLEIDEKYAPKIVKQLYDDWEEDEILDLDDSIEYIKIEQDILNYNKEELEFYAGMIDDEDQLYRIAMAHLSKEELTDAEIIQRKIDNDDLAKKINDTKEKMKAAGKPV